MFLYQIKKMCHKASSLVRDRTDQSQACMRWQHDQVWAAWHPAPEADRHCPEGKVKMGSAIG